MFMESEIRPTNWRLPEFFPDLNKDILSKFKRYEDEILRLNNAINLVSIKTIGSSDIHHFADSILAARIIVKDAPHVTLFHDIGFSSGFPGIILGLLYPQVKVHLIESDLKKFDFLKHLVTLFDMKNIDLSNQTLDKLSESSILHAISRNPAPLSQSLMQARKFIKSGGSYYHIKSPKWPTEIGQLPTQLCSIWQPSLVSEYKLPLNLGKFAVIKSDRIN